MLAIVTALKEKNIIINDRLTAWDKRQPKREDDSRERVRRYRDKGSVTHRNAEQRTVTTEQSREEQNREERVEPTSRVNGSLEKEHFAEKTNAILNAAAKATKHTNGGPNYNDPAERKHRWEQKIIEEINRRLPPANARIIIDGYLRGEREAKAFFNKIDADVKRQEARV